MAPEPVTSAPNNARQCDPGFLFAAVLAARRVGNRGLESAARAQLAALGISVRIARRSRQGVSHAAR